MLIFLVYMIHISRAIQSRASDMNGAVRGRQTWKFQPEEVSEIMRLCFVLDYSLSMMLGH